MRSGTGSRHCANRRIRRPDGSDQVTDPFAVLGLDREADLGQLRAARRRLARDLHPDHGGDPAAMQQLNVAFDLCVGHVTGRRPIPPSSMSRRGFRGVERDMPSFAIDALPAEAFEALLVVASWIGEVLDDDPPYVLECHLSEPLGCWCRLEVVPDAGGSTVSLTVASPDGGDAVHAEHVRDVWVEQLNRLGGPPL